MTQSPTEDRIFHRVMREKWQRISHGKGVYLFDSEGRPYLDACAGVHVVSIGHGVEEVTRAMTEQAEKVCFTYSHFLSDSQIDLAAKITSMAPAGLDRAFFISGGSEATESALKIARKYHVETGNPQKHKVVSRWQSWHGNTIGALSMSGRSSWRHDYAPYLLNFPHIPSPFCDHCPYGKTYPECNLSCAEELERVIHQEGSHTISAFIAEPVLGTSAAGLAPPDDYFPTIREICDRHNCFGSLSMRIFASSTKLLLHICFWIICSLCLFIQRPKGFDPEGGTLLDKKAPLPPRSLFPFPLKKTKPSPSAPPTAGRYPQNLGTSSLETAAFVGIFHPC